MPMRSLTLETIADAQICDDRVELDFRLRLHIERADRRLSLRVQLGRGAERHERHGDAREPVLVNA